ncbi:hypothetical protein MTR67_012789 [Solanum verrucosum]|uniref:Uncharacterized protein n=1 Tax=Solanum verrucosum TaxID=315347 RepID=A0AAF0THT5_SOLVR|nr:hypothetical protein MTR67_012789 [Solanum verrucosum]
MITDMRSRMSLFVVGLTHLSSKESKATMLVGYMGIARLMIHVQQIEKKQLKDREEFENKRAKTSENESGKQKSNANRSSFQHKQKDLIHHLLVHLHQGIKLCTIVKIFRISELDLRIHESLRERGFARCCHWYDPSLHFDVLPEQLLEPFNVSTLVGESILAERVYRDCPISINHKSTMADLIELDMVDFDI